MTDLAELERRIIAALARVDAGLDRLQQAPVVAQAADEAGSPDPWGAAEAPEGPAAEMVSEGAPVAEPAAVTEPIAAAGVVAEPPQADPAEIDTLRTALLAERAQVVALTDRIRTLKTRESRSEANLQSRIEQLTKQLDVQGLELHRLRKSMIQLREALRVLREGADGTCVDAAMINKAMLAELEGLRAARSSETVELEEIIAELAALTGEEKADA